VIIVILILYLSTKLCISHFTTATAKITMIIVLVPGTVIHVGLGPVQAGLGLAGVALGADTFHIKIVRKCVFVYCVKTMIIETVVTTFPSQQSHAIVPCRPKDNFAIHK